jgi:hypothetical protein
LCRSFSVSNLAVASPVKNPAFWKYFVAASGNHFFTGWLI